MSQSNFNRITLKAPSVGEVLIYDTIGQDWFGEGLTAKSFDASLKALGPVETLEIRINSGGGDVFHGSAIYSLLLAHPAKKMVYIDGIAASMASIIAMAGDEIHMAANALFMIHEPSGMAFGTAEEMLATAALLEQISSNAVDVYTARTGQDKATVKAAMLAETWFTAEQAKEAGYVTTITPNKQLTAHVDVSMFSKAPAWAQDRLKQFTSLKMEGKSMPEASKEIETTVAPVAAQVDAEAIKAQATKDERDRCGRIHAKCALAGRPDLAQAFIDDASMSVSDVADKLLDVVCKKNKPVGDEGSSDNGQSAEDPNAKYKAEFSADPQYAKAMTEAEYISMRRVDDGLAQLKAPMNS